MSCNRQDAAIRDRLWLYAIAMQSETYLLSSADFSSEHF
jgi:hypothetical protein